MSGSIPLPNLLAAIWVPTSVAIVLAAGRLVIRLGIVGSLHWDDYCALMALALLIPFQALNTVSAPYSYMFAAIADGKAPSPSPEQLNALTIQTEKYGFGAEALFWTTLFLVKFSFLCLYREFLRGSGLTFKVWWSSFAFILASYGICISGWLGQCGRVQDSFMPAVCAASRQLDLKLTWMQMAFNIATDFLIMLLPLRTLYNLNARFSQKITIMSLFLLALVTVAFEVLRAVEFYKSFEFYTTVYTSLQVSFAVIISMLPTYGVIISNSELHRSRRMEFWRLVTLRSRSSASDRSVALHSIPSENDTASRTERQESAGKAIDRADPYARYDEDCEERTL